MTTKPNQAPAYRMVPAFMRAMREEAGLTQRALAKQIGVSQWWVARIETGSRRLDVAEFLLFCKGCNVDPAKAIRSLQSH